MENWLSIYNPTSSWETQSWNPGADRDFVFRRHCSSNSMKAITLYLLYSTSKSNHNRRYNSTKPINGHRRTCTAVFYTSEGARLNAKLHTAREVLLFAMSLANCKYYICKAFHFAGLLIVYKSDAPRTRGIVRTLAALAVLLGIKFGEQELVVCERHSVKYLRLGIQVTGTSCRRTRQIKSNEGKVRTFRLSYFCFTFKHRTCSR